MGQIAKVEFLGARNPIMWVQASAKADEIYVTPLIKEATFGPPLLFVSLVRLRPFGRRYELFPAMPGGYKSS